jgi:thiol-disulfide isomerase/thioredoxin
MPLLRSIRLSVGLVIAISLGTGACRRGPTVPQGDILATLTLPSIAGDELDPQSLTGKPSLLLFVTPTCVHCLATLPHAIEAARSRDANVVAIFVSGEADGARRVAQELKFPGPVLLDDGTLRKEYAIGSVPYTLVLAADGHATDAFTGEQATSTLAGALAAAR